MIPNTCFPIVTDRDRQWALARRPDWARAGGTFDEPGEIVDDGGWLDAEKEPDGSPDDRPDWFNFVIAQIENFERYFAGEMRPRDEWSKLWRYGWWPKIKPELYFPHMAKKKTEPFFRKGTQEFAIALRLGTEDEKRMWIRFGIAQFKPDDPRVQKIQNGAKKKEAAE